MIKDIIQKDTNPKYYNLFAMLIMVTGICSSLLGQRLITIVGSSPLSGGILPFCLSFMLLDIVTNQYGLAKTKSIIYNYLIAKIAMALILYTTMHIPVASVFHNESSYTLVIGMILRSFWASSFGALVAFLLNAVIFSKLYISFQGKHLWLRCLIATTFGELVFSLVSTPILFYDKLSLISIVQLIFHNYSFKIVFEVITLPVIYLSTYWLGKYEIKSEIQYHDFKPLHKEINPSL